MNLTNGGAVAIMPTVPSDVKAGVNGSGQQAEAQVPRLRPINTKEFEEFVGSSPFDDALLKSIDDKQELNSVFANVQPLNNGTSSYNYRGPNHPSPYNNFNPT